MRIFFFIAIFFSQLILSSDSNYVFGWTQLDNPDLMTPRGGTSSGPDVDLDKTPNPLWKEIQNGELTKFEKDRLAILAMQGEHKINFDFMETMGFTKDYIPSKPYQSWGTEFVIAVEDKLPLLSTVILNLFPFGDDNMKSPLKEPVIPPEELIPPSAIILRLLLSLIHI